MFRPAYTGDRIVIELSVDDGKAARLGTGAAAASDEGIHRRQLDAFVLQRRANHFFAKRQLVVHMCKRQQDRRLMKKVLVKHNLLVIEKTDLRRCRTGIKHHYLHFTARSVASFSKCKRPRFFLRGRHSRFIP